LNFSTAANLASFSGSNPAQSRANLNPDSTDY